MVIGSVREIKDNEYRVGLVRGGVKTLVDNRHQACLQALDAFPEWKPLYIDYSGTLQRAQIDA